MYLGNGRVDARYAMTNGPDSWHSKVFESNFVSHGVVRLHEIRVYQTEAVHSTGYKTYGYLGSYTAATDNIDFLADQSGQPGYSYTALIRAQQERTQ